MAAPSLCACSPSAWQFSVADSAKSQRGVSCLAGVCQSGSSSAATGAQRHQLSSTASSSRGISLYSLLELPLGQCCPAGWQPLKVSNVGWDPENILGPPVIGHISRRSSQKSLAEAEQEREMEEKRRRAAREARAVPETENELIDYFLATETQEMRFEVARCRPLLTESFLSALKSETSQIRFAKVQTDADQDRLAELEALEAALAKHIADYDKMALEFLSRKDVLQAILMAKDKKAYLLELAAQDRLDPPLLALLDHNIASAQAANEPKTAEFMQKLRSGVVKYMTV